MIIFLAEAQFIKLWQDILVQRPKLHVSFQILFSALIKAMRRKIILQDNMVPTLEEKVSEYGIQLKEKQKQNTLTEF